MENPYLGPNKRRLGKLDWKKVNKLKFTNHLAKPVT